MSTNERTPLYPPGLGVDPKEEPRTIIRTSRMVVQKDPIVSCGVICLRKRDDDLYVLLIRRKDSLAYVEFVRGKYKPSDPHYVRQLVDGMTFEERRRIMTKEFDDLWKTMWISKSYRRHRPEYDKSFSRFESVKKGIREYIEKNPMVGWKEPEWGFPKGRPNRGESVIQCAIREFKEETGIPKEKLIIINGPEYEEYYTGTNGILYRNKYVIGTCYEVRVGVDPLNHHQAKEISGVKWVRVRDAPDSIRKTYPSRLVILENASMWFLENYE